MYAKVYLKVACLPPQPGAHAAVKWLLHLKKNAGGKCNLFLPDESSKVPYLASAMDMPGYFLDLSSSLPFGFFQKLFCSGFSE